MPGKPDGRRVTRRLSGSRQISDVRGEPCGVTKRLSVPEADDVGLEGRQSTGRIPVPVRLVCGESERLGEALPERQWIAVEQDISQHQHPITLSPEGEMAGGVSRRGDHLEATDLIALRQDPRDRVSSAGEPLHEVRESRVGVRQDACQIPGLDGLTIPFTTPQRNLQALAHEMAASLMIDVRVRERVRRHVMP